MPVVKARVGESLTMSAITESSTVDLNHSGRVVGSKRPRFLGGKEVTCAEAQVCEKWILHRFRKNFATDRHNGGASARKIQKWIGHSSLETTLLYLVFGEDTSEEVRNIINCVHVGL